MSDQARMKFATAAQQWLHKTKPGMSDENVDKVLDLIMKDQAVIDSIIFRIGDEHFVSVAEIERHVARVNPPAELFVQFPTVKDAHAALVEKHKEIFGTEPTGDDRLRLYREAEALTPEQRAQIAEAGQSGELPRQAPPVHPAVFDEEAHWDALIEKRLGLKPHEVPAAKRASYVAELKSRTDPRREREKEALDVVEEENLSATERLTKHRLSLAAKG